MSPVRSRFAPSPTGYLHIGGARTALFALLAARQMSGQFILRIDDTDRQRSSPTYHDEILESLSWLGYDWDEGPYYQSQRSSEYQGMAERLLREGKAYRCYCTAAELDAKRTAAVAAGRTASYDGTCRDRRAVPGDTRPYTIRFRGPKHGETEVPDILKGTVRFQNAQLDDLILVRSDGSATYNFCSVFDDADLQISHIVRGDDHLTNSPRQVLIFQAIGAPVPRFAHLPLILGSDRSPLSKRHGATSVRAYRENGYLPEALTNFLARLGWSHGDAEVFSFSELRQKFKLADVGASAGVFNEEKLAWLNAHYLSRKTAPELMHELSAFWPDKAYGIDDDAWAARMVATLQPRAKTLADLVEQASFFISEEIEPEEKAAKKFLKPPSLALLAELRSKLEEMTTWEEVELHNLLNSFSEKSGIKLGKVAQPLRVALTGRTASPGIFEVMEVLGKRRCLERIDRVLIPAVSLKS